MSRPLIIIIIDSLSDEFEISLCDSRRFINYFFSSLPLSFFSFLSFFLSVLLFLSGLVLFFPFLFCFALLLSVPLIQILIN